MEKFYFFSGIGLKHFNAIVNDNSLYTTYKQNL